MKIAIIGYGKMGKVIEKIALNRAHEIVAKLSSKDSITSLDSKKVDVAIEFTNPKSAYSNINYCIENNIPIVSGSTGWLDKFDEVKSTCGDKKGSFFYASNFSVGVNIFFKLNKILAKMMDNQPSYDVKMEEIHHTEKKDTPSGTGITLAEDIVQSINRKTKWVNEESQNKVELPIISKRIDKVPGTHTIQYESTVDTIEIKHTAHSREGFALGAVLAVEWLHGKKGVFGMNDMIKL